MDRNELYTEFWNLLQTSEDYLKYGKTTGAEAPEFTSPAEAAPAEQAAVETPAVHSENCASCSMAKSGRRPVASLGNPDSSLWVITDAPSLEAERLNSPLGDHEMDYFQKWMSAIELNVPNDLYLQNLTHCRTPGSRPPFPEELKRCAAEIAEELKKHNPRVILSMGPNCSAWLTGQAGKKVSELRSSRYTWEGIPLLVTYSPDQVLSFGELKRPVWEDLKNLRNMLNGS